MLAVFSHELKSHFHSLSAYVFGAFLLIFTGIGAMLYNINAAVSNFEYVLEFCSIVFVVIVPLLTMRVIAEERRQKTDQLLYSLPITTTQIVLGKYLALMIVFIIPVIFISLYPPVFAHFGDVYLPTAYGSLFAFVLMGAALIALGMFISSLTESQGFAAGITLAVILFNYFSVSLAEYVSTSAYTSLLALVFIAVFIGITVKLLTKNDYLAYGTVYALVGALMVTYFVDMSKLEGILPAVMKKLSLFKQFSTFVDGVFDLTAVVFFVSIIVFFVFLTVQSLEKRRYN